MESIVDSETILEETKVKMEDREVVSLPVDEDNSLEQTQNSLNDNKMEEVDDESKLEDAEEEGEEEGEEEERYREPILDGRNITFKTRILNQYLLCSLCMGYFKDAHTIIECLHTFCKSCIYKYLREHYDCPQCGVNLGTYPYEKLKFDRQVQTMLDKILPDVVSKDAQLEREYYEKKGIKIDLPPPVTSKPQEEIEPVAKKIKKSELKKFYSEEVSFELSLDESETNLQLKKLDKPFIRTSARVTVKQLKKYLQKKLCLDSIQQLEITYRGEVLGTEHSLEYILKTRGMDPRSKNPTFKYKTISDQHLLF